MAMSAASSITPDAGRTKCCRTDPPAICARRLRSEEDLVDNRFAANLDDMTDSSGEYAAVADSAYQIPATVSNKIGDPNLIAGPDQYGQLFANRIAPAIEGAAQ